jgi:hypothetical protein
MSIHVLALRWLRSEPQQTVPGMFVTHFPHLNELRLHVFPALEGEMLLGQTERTRRAFVLQNA